MDEIKGNNVFFIKVLINKIHLSKEKEGKEKKKTKRKSDDIREDGGSKKKQRMEGGGHINSGLMPTQLNKKVKHIIYIFLFFD